MYPFTGFKEPLFVSHRRKKYKVDRTTRSLKVQNICYRFDMALLRRY